MPQKIEYAVRQAIEARRVADTMMDTHMRDEWLRVAALWDELVISYGEIQRLREGAMVDDLSAALSIRSGEDRP